MLGRPGSGAPTDWFDLLRDKAATRNGVAGKLPSEAVYGAVWGRSLPSVAYIDPTFFQGAPPRAAVDAWVPKRGLSLAQRTQALDATTLPLDRYPRLPEGLRCYAGRTTTLVLTGVREYRCIMS